MLLILQVRKMEYVDILQDLNIAEIWHLDVILHQKLKYFDCAKRHCGQERTVTADIPGVMTGAKQHRHGHKILKTPGTWEDMSPGNWLEIESCQWAMMSAAFFIGSNK